MAIATPPLARRKKLLGALVETTAGTLNAPSAALAMNIYDAKMNPVDMFPDARNPHGNYFGTSDRIKGPLMGRCTFRWEMAHGDALMTLLKGCGFTTNSGLSVATPSSNIADHSTLSLALWEDGRKKLMRGCSGTITLEGANGSRCFGSAEYQGVWNSVVDQAMPALAPINTAGYRAVSMTLTVGGAALPLMSNFSLALNSAVEMRQDIISAAGLLHYLVTDINPQLTVDPEARLVADHDAYGLLLAGTTGAVSIVLTAGANTLIITGARGQRISVEDGERDGKVADPIVIELQNSSGNDSVTLTKT